MLRLLVVCFVALSGLVACSGSGSGDECPKAMCGPALGMPNRICPDGVTVSGPTGECLQNPDGTCGWEVKSCPP